MREKNVTALLDALESISKLTKVKVYSQKEGRPPCELDLPALQLGLPFYLHEAHQSEDLVFPARPSAHA